MSETGFNTEDRAMLRAVNDRSIANNTLLKTHGPRLKNLENEDKVIHGRITRLAVASASVGTAVTGFFTWLKMKTGG